MSSSEMLASGLTIASGWRRVVFPPRKALVPILVTWRRGRVEGDVDVLPQKDSGKPVLLLQTGIAKATAGLWGMGERGPGWRVILLPVEVVRSLGLRMLGKLLSKGLS
jgi:hypothetical protein